MVTTAAPARVVRVDGSHLHALTEFYREVWDRAATVSGVQQSRAAAAERNIADPGAAIPTYLFMRGERALGHLTTIPLRLWLDQSDRAAHWLKGLMVLPEARNGPVGFLLLKSAIAELNPTLALVVEPEAIRLYTALGFTDVGVMPNYVLPLRTQRLLRGVAVDTLGLQGVRGAALDIARHRFVAPLLGGIADVARLAWTVGAAGADAEESDTVSRDVDGLWRRARQGIAVAPVRTASALRARYVTAPANYRFITARSAGSIEGIAVLRKPAQAAHPRLPGVRVAVLSDMLVDSARTDVVLGLLRKAEMCARAEGADALLCSASHAMLAAPLRRRGFLRIPGNVHVLARGLERVQPLDRWWLFRGDSAADEVF